MIKYNFVVNDYETSKKMTINARTFLNEKKWVESTNPDYVFILGGDGTFLRAIHQYEKNIDKIKFIPFKWGGVGYYTNLNMPNDFRKVIESIEAKTAKEINHELIEVVFNGATKLALNEVKIVNEAKAIYTNVYVDGEFLEEFHGTGLTFSTSTGSTGYMKSTGGSIIYPTTAGIFQMNELFPVSTNKFRTINAPLILSNNNLIKLVGELNCQNIIIDTVLYELKSNEIDIKISNKVVNVIVSNPNISRVSMLREIFVIDREKID